MNTMKTIITPCSYIKTLLSKKIIIEPNNDIDCGYDFLKESLQKKYHELESKNIVFGTDTASKRNFMNIFEEEPSSFFIVDGIYFDKDSLENIDEDIEEEKIKEAKEKILILEIKITGYYQSEWGTYKIFFDKTKITEEEISKEFQNLKYLFKVQNYDAILQARYNIQVIDDNTKEIIENRTETENIDNVLIPYWGELFGDNLQEYLSNEAKEYLGKEFDVQFTS